jgi:hypothetical protein
LFYNHYSQNIFDCEQNSENPFKDLKYVGVLFELWNGFQNNHECAKHNNDKQADIKQSSGACVSLKDYFVQSFLHIARTVEPINIGKGRRPSFYVFKTYFKVDVNA